jgi:hypothetical protein
VFRAAGENEKTQGKNTRDWLELEDRDLRCQLLSDEEMAAVIFFSFH